jgi:transcriptional regulator with XRE-family HTH domain
MTEDLSVNAESISPALPTQEEMVVSAVRAGRLALGWTQGDLASASGVSEVSIARMETSAISPRLGTISKIQGALQDAGVTININQPPGGFTLSLTPSAVAVSRKRYVSSHIKGSARSPAPEETTAPTT